MSTAVRILGGIVTFGGIVSAFIFTAPMVAACLTLFLIAVWLFVVVVSLNAELDTHVESLPVLVFGEGRVDPANLVLGEPTGVRIERVTNFPCATVCNVGGSLAKDVHPTMRILDENGNDLIEGGAIEARWANTVQPGAQEEFAPLDRGITQMDIPANHVSEPINCVMQYVDEEPFRIWSNRTMQARGAGALPTVPSTDFIVEFQVRGSNVGPVTQRYRVKSTPVGDQFLPVIEKLD